MLGVMLQTLNLLVAPSKVLWFTVLPAVFMLWLSSFMLKFALTHCHF